MKSTSPKTTFLGIAAIVQVCIAAAVALFDGDPATTPDWQEVATQITLGAALLFARDNKTSDQKAGARPEPTA